MNETSVFRFAPSPNGELHLGHALSALTGFVMARRCGGRFLLRIEDIDLQRSREDFVTQILDDLAWLGITWDGPVIRQSSRFAIYAQAAQTLTRRGLLYPCFATRREIDDAVAANPTGTDPDGAPLYPGLCKGLDAQTAAGRMAAGEPWCLRIDMEAAVSEARRILGGASLDFTSFDSDGQTAVIAADPLRWGDAVIVRKDTPASYHLAVVIDDAAQGVSHVTRGLDLLAATDLHRLLQVLLGLPAPLYHHHRLLMDADGRKLSKSARDTSLRSLREAGAAPAVVIGLTGFDPKDLRKAVPR